MILKLVCYRDASRDPEDPPAYMTNYYQGASVTCRDGKKAADPLTVFLEEKNNVCREVSVLRDSCDAFLMGDDGRTIEVLNRMQN